MSDLVDADISRVSNAYVESHNKSYKINVLKGKKRNTIGDVCRLLQEHNSFLVPEEHLQGPKTRGKVKTRDAPLYPDTSSNPFQVEKWGRKKSELIIQKTNKRRYTHIEGRDSIKINRNLENENPEEINKTKSSQQRRKKIKETPFNKLKRLKKDTVSNQFSDEVEE